MSLLDGFSVPREIDLLLVLGKLGIKADADLASNNLHRLRIDQIVLGKNRRMAHALDDFAPLVAQHISVRRPTTGFSSGSRLSATTAGVFVFDRFRIRDFIQARRTLGGGNRRAADRPAPTTRA